MGTETLYGVLQVDEDVDPAEIRAHVKDNIEYYRSEIETASDSDETERRYIIAHEVLTNPREKYLYDLLGHNEYVQERLTEDVFETIATDEDETDVFINGVNSADTGTGTRIFSPDETTASTVETGTRVFGEDENGQGGDTDLSTSQTDSDSTTPAPESNDTQDLTKLTRGSKLVEQLATLQPSLSPLRTLPRLQSAHRHWFEIGYVSVVFAVFAAFAYFAPYGGVAFTLLTLSTLTLGAATTYVVAAVLYRRSLLKRSVLGTVLAAIPIGIALFVEPSISTTAIIGGVAIGLASIWGTNSYVEATRRYRRQSGSPDQTLHNNHTQTNPGKGETKAVGNSEDLLDRFAAQHQGLIPTVPRDFPEAATVHQKRRIVAERHIERRLFVKDDSESHEQPASALPRILTEYRDDVQDRDNNYPTEYSGQTYEYIVPSSITEQVCPKCNGNQTVTCPKCNGSKNITCRKCGGDMRNPCRKCNTKGRVEQSDGSYQDCSRCGADGYIPCSNCSATGEETCPRCSGRGIIDCPRCETDGKVVRYQTLTRTYTADKEVRYITRSVPERFLTDADGTRVKKDEQFNTNPDANSGDLFRKEKEEQEISVTVVTYEYADHLWELYEIEDTLAWPNRPRNLSLRYKTCGVVATLFFVWFLSIGVYGSAAIP
jgi:DnaJ-class molecular chaperone